jgi:hypothetical protein
MRRRLSARVEWFPTAQAHRFWVAFAINIAKLPELLRR